MFSLWQGSQASLTTVGQLWLPTHGRLHHAGSELQPALPGLCMQGLHSSWVVQSSQYIARLHCSTIRLQMLPKHHTLISAESAKFNLAAFKRCVLTVVTITSILCCHCLPAGLFQATTIFGPTATALGVKSPLEDGSHRSAASWHCSARELQAYTALPCLMGRGSHFLMSRGDVVMLAICARGPACILFAQPSAPFWCNSLARR